MSEMKIVSKASHKVLQELNGQKAALTEASVVVIKANMDDVQQIVKDGKNAVITLKNGEKIVIENFFTGVGYETENSLVLNDDDNKLLWAQFTDANGAMLDNITFGYIDTIEPLLYHDGAYSLWGWLAVPLTVAGILIWAGSSSGDDGSDKITRVLDKPEVDPINGKDPITGRGDPDTEIIVTFPDGKTETVTVDKDGTWTAPNPGLEDGDEVVVVAKDKDGNTSPPVVVIVDAIAPPAPIIDPVNGKDPITGTAEPESKVTVTFPDGKTVTVTADENGAWTVPNPGLEDGDKVVAVAEDKAGNVSPPTTAIVDAIAPPAPIIDPINGKDPITGTAEPESKVTVTFPDGKTKTVTTDKDGSWTVPNPGLEDGDKVVAVAEDKAGNVSPPTTVIVDAIAPPAPIIDPVNGKDPITGTAEPESKLTVTFPDGKTVTVTTDKDGSWTVPNPGLEDGDKVVAVAKDKAGNVSPPTTAIVDAIAPPAPIVDPINGKDPITGTAEPESKVTVTFPDGKTKTVTTDKDGSWTVPNPGLEDGDKVVAVAEDKAGNVSPPTTAIVDAVAPPAPIVDPINGKDPITGTAEPESKVTVTFPDGKTKTVTTDKDGSWTVPNPGLEDGDKVVAVTEDKAGNVSPPTTVIVDAIAPPAPIIDPVNGKDPITGTAEPESKLTVTFPDGKTVTVTTGKDGSWTVPNPGLEDGDKVVAVAKDKAGNVSPPTTAIVDAIAPPAPIVDPINGKDPITGTAEPESKVTVTFPDGKTKTVTTDKDGSWTVPNPGLEDGDKVVAVAEDKAGNVSPPTTVIVDAIAPPAPIIDPLDGIFKGSH